MARTLVSAKEKIMEFTTNRTRVPIPQGTTTNGKHAESGLAPANTDLLPDNVSPSETHEGVAPNPTGRATPEEEGNRPKLITCRNQVIISTFNTRTLGPIGRIEELVVCAKNQSIDIIDVQEQLYFPS